MSRPPVARQQERPNGFRLHRSRGADDDVLARDPTHEGGREGEFGGAPNPSEVEELRETVRALEAELRRAKAASMDSRSAPRSLTGSAPAPSAPRFAVPRRRLEHHASWSGSMSSAEEERRTRRPDVSRPSEDWDEVSEVDAEEHEDVVDVAPEHRRAVRWDAGMATEPSPAHGTASRPATSDVSRLTADELFLRKVAANLERLVAGRKPVVLVSTGAYNPIHLYHTRMFYLARSVRSFAIDDPTLPRRATVAWLAPSSRSI